MVSLEALLESESSSDSSSFGFVTSSWDPNALTASRGFCILSSPA